MIEGINRKGDRYVEFWMGTIKADERIRVTLVKDTYTGKPTFRVQKRGARGRLFKGPEFPASQAIQIIAAFSMLVTA